MDDHPLEPHVRIVEQMDRSESGERYIVGETYEGEFFVIDRENPDAWIRSDVTYSLEG